MAARKSGKSSNKSAKSAPARRKSPARGKSKTIPRSASRRSSSGQKRQQPLTAKLSGWFRGIQNRLAPNAKPPKPSSQEGASFWGSLSLDRKLDIIGVAIAFIGFLTVLSLLSPYNSAWVSAWMLLLARTFGWGMYVFPFALIITGLWLLLRNFERIPNLPAERALGFGLLFFVLLVVIHLGGSLALGVEPLALAEAGLGGGYLGGGILAILIGGLGQGGTIILLTAWLLIALVMALDVTVVDLFGWIPALFFRARDQLSQFWNNFGLRRRLASRSQNDRPGDLMPIFGDTAEVHPTAALASAAPLPPGFNGPTQTEARTWKLPEVDQILDPGGDAIYDDESDRQRAALIEETLSSFGAPGRVVAINRGPTITQFGVEPDFIESRAGRTRVRVSKIAGLADDLALALSARAIRIQAPVPGEGYVGIEVPNEEVTLVALQDVIESSAFKKLKSPLAFALGQNVAGHVVAADLAAMPHLLIAGATGAGKSVSVNALISCLLLNNTPNELRLIMVDPKRVELTNYNGIPHLLAPVVVDLERVVGALQWVTREMDMRYRKLAEAGARNVQDYNEKCEQRGERKLPYLVVIIDELADLMMLAPDETERSITRLAQLARATGIHLVIATQRPSVDVVTGLIKANFPARVAFAVASGVDSRVILDQPGAERLLGRGDMLFQAPDAPAPVRLQGVFVSDGEIARLVDYWRGFNGTPVSNQVAVGGIVDALPSNLPLKQLPMWEEATTEDEKDPLFEEAVDLIRRQGRASISMLQRRLRIGYTRAARLIEFIEARGIISAPEPGTGNRTVLDYGPAAPPVEEQ